MSKSFEENITELEQIVSKLENGNCGLDESIELYSKGLKLSAECKKQLDVAKQKIENIADYLENENV
jgi:exodeoxyribonuclease VII small subunit